MSDGTARVRGNVRHVYKYLADLEHMDQWYPGASGIQRMGSRDRPVSVGTRYWVEKDFLAFKLPIRYEILDLSPDKKVVFSGVSDAHNTTDQLVLMPDPNDRDFTIVRYISEFKLLQWRAALQPVLKGWMSKVPDVAMSELSRLLNGPRTPIANWEAAERTHAKASGPRWAGFGNLFGGKNGSSATSRDNNQGGARSRVDKSAEPTFGSKGTTAGANGAHLLGECVLEGTLGYYRLLGLSASANVTTDQVKAAYRKAAMQLHPDKTAGTDSFTQSLAAEQFARVQAAYDTLKDPEKRRAYHDGTLLQHVP